MSIEDKLDILADEIMGLKQTLATILERLPEKRKPRKRVNKPAAEHDKAVDLEHYPSEEWRKAWQAYCDKRRSMGNYMTANSVSQHLKKLSPFTEAEQIDALYTAENSGWQMVFPKRQMEKGQDWFNA